MATAGTRWAILMSRGAGYSDQVLHFKNSFVIKNPCGIEEIHLIFIYILLSMLNVRLWNLISCIPVKVFIEGGIMVIASPQLLQHGTRLLLFLVFQEENQLMKLRRHYAHLLFLVLILR